MSLQSLDELVESRKRGLWYAVPFVTSDTDAICEGYDEEGYTSMNTDTLRNSVYSTAIKHGGSFKDNWVDLGTGGAALLSLMILKHHTSKVQLAGLECNPKSAHAANKLYQKLANNGLLIHGNSGNKQVLKQLRHFLQTGKRVCVVHEIFGFFASSEGAPLAISQLRNGLPKHNLHFIPSKAVTFFQPACISAKALKNINELYVSPKLVLGSKLQFEKVVLTKEALGFEYYNFNSDVPQLEQSYTHRFEVSHAGEFNSFACFLYVDFGISVPRGTTCPDYPFGDFRLQGSPTNLAFSSRVSSSCYASNWKNPIILLPRGEHVNVGDEIEVETLVLVDSMQPCYKFYTRIVRKSDPAESEEIVEIGETILQHADLYPQWQKIK